MDLIGSVIAVVIGVLLLVWTAHIILHIFAWILIVGGIIWAVKNFVGGRRGSRTDL